MMKDKGDERFTFAEWNKEQELRGSRIFSFRDKLIIFRIFSSADNFAYVIELSDLYQQVDIHILWNISSFQ